MGVQSVVAGRVYTKLSVARWSVEHSGFQSYWPALLPGGHPGFPTCRRGRVPPPEAGGAAPRCSWTMCTSGVHYIAGESTSTQAPPADDWRRQGREGPFGQKAASRGQIPGEWIQRLRTVGEVHLSISGCCAKFRPQRTLSRPKRADSSPRAEPMIL